MRTWRAVVFGRSAGFTLSVSVGVSCFILGEMVSLKSTSLNVMLRPALQLKSAQAVPFAIGWHRYREGSSPTRLVRSAVLSLETFSFAPLAEFCYKPRPPRAHDLRAIAWNGAFTPSRDVWIWWKMWRHESPRIHNGDSCMPSQNNATERSAASVTSMDDELKGEYLCSPIRLKIG